MNISYSLIVDLTHTLEESSPSWTGESCFCIKNLRDYKDCAGEVKFRSQQIITNAGQGTHIDSPSHCFAGTQTVAQIPLSNLIVPCVVIDVSLKADENYKVSIDDIMKFEEYYGKIQSGSFVIIRTGWDKWWNTPKQYHNNHLFPSISADAAQLLVERDVVGVGIDTLSTDLPESGFPVHGIVLGAGKYIVENIANAGQLPPIGSTIVVMPLPIKDAAETPIRLIALV